MMLSEVLLIISGVFFMASAGAAFLFRNHFIGGETSKEWKYLYTGLVLSGLFYLLEGVSKLISSDMLMMVSEIGVFAGAGITAFSCFVFWNRFRL